MRPTYFRVFASIFIGSIGAVFVLTGVMLNVGALADVGLAGCLYSVALLAIVFNRVLREVRAAHAAHCAEMERVCELDVRRAWLDGRWDLVHEMQRRGVVRIDVDQQGQSHARIVRPVARTEAN